MVAFGTPPTAFTCGGGNDGRGDGRSNGRSNGRSVVKGIGGSVSRAGRAFGLRYRTLGPRTVHSPGRRSFAQFSTVNSPGNDARTAGTTNREAERDESEDREPQRWAIHQQ